MINYQIIQDSIDYYSKCGFERIESPWAVSSEVADITKPEGKTNFIIKHNDKALVASGEQSFLYLYLKGFLPKGCYQSVTPCFRYESFDILHTKYFIKNELIDTKSVHMQRVEDILNTSLYFFQKYLPGAEIKKTKIGYDIEYKGHELGSYGIRSCDFLDYIYGTAVAEPRLTMIMNKFRNEL